MMQFHYIVFYDSEMDEWRVDNDMTYNHLDGNIYNPDNEFGQGWFFAEECSKENDLDYAALSVLKSYIGNIPTPARVEA